MIGEIVAAIKLVKEMKDSDKSKSSMKTLIDLITGRNMPGLRRAAQDSTRYFPVIVTSNSGSPDNLAVFLRTIQANNIAMLTLAISNNDIIEYQKGASKLDFLRMLHTNLDLTGRNTSSDVARSLGNLVTSKEDAIVESVNHGTLEDLKFEVIDARIDAHNDQNDAVTQAYGEAVKFEVENFLTESDQKKDIEKNVEVVKKAISDFEKYKSILRDKLETRESQLEAEIDQLEEENTQLQDQLDTDPSLTVDERDAHLKTITNNERAINKIRSQLERIQNDTHKKLGELDRKIDVKKREISDYTKQLKELEDEERERFNTGNKVQILDEPDINKLASMAPTLLRLEINYILPNMSTPTKAEITIGVKASPHLVDSENAVEYLAETYKRGKPIFQTIRWLTGEKNLVRDLFFDIDRRKADARARGNERIWARLRGYTQISRVRNLIGYFVKSARKNPIIPNASLIVSQEDNDTLQANHGIDLMDDKVASKICAKLGFVEIFIATADERDRPEAVVYDRETNSYNRYSHKLLTKMSAKDSFSTSDLMKILKR